MNARRAKRCVRQAGRRVGWCLLGLALFVATAAATGSWQSVGPYGASVTTLTVCAGDPWTVYLGTSSGGIFRSADHGQTWSSTGFEGSGIVGRIAVDPADPHTLFAATSNGFWMSGDGGETWTPRNAGLTTTYLYTVCVDPSSPSTLYVGAWGALFKTVDAGLHWTSVEAFAGPGSVLAIAVDPRRPEVVYAGTTDRGVVRSLDGGANWSTQSVGLDDLYVRDLLIDPTDPQTLYVATNQRGVYRSDDAGDTWVSAYQGAAGGSYCLDMDPTSRAVLVGTQGAGAFQSRNRGKDWEPWTQGLPAGASIQALTVLPGNEGLLAGLFAHGVYHAQVPGAVWERSNLGLAGYVVSSLWVDEVSGTWLAGVETYGPGAFRSADAGERWTVSGAGMVYPPVYCLARDPTDPAVFYSGNAGSLFRSLDGALTWTASDEGLPRGFVHVYALLPDRAHPGTLLAGTSRGIFRSTDGGRRWVPAFPDVTIRALIASPDPSGPFLAAGDAGSLLSSQDRGKTWTVSSQGLPESRTVQCLCVDPVVTGTVFAGTQGGGIYRSRDGGATWSPMPESAETMITYSLLALRSPSETILAGTSHGVFWFDRDALHWLPVGAGLPAGTVIRTLWTDDARGKLLAGGIGGVFILDWDP